MKLNSIWNRRLVIAGARKLRDITALSKVFITADDPLNFSRRNTSDRLKFRAQRDGKTVSVSTDGVLSIDGVDFQSTRKIYLCTVVFKQHLQCLAKIHYNGER